MKEILPSDDKFDEFIEEIRVGDLDKSLEYLNEEGGMELLRKEFHQPMTLDEIVELELALNDTEDSFEDSGGSTLILQPLQLAIVAQQGDIIKAILRHIIAQNDADAIISLLTEYLGHRARIDFPTEDTERYDKDDRSLDGMNAFHLAAKYFPLGLEVIFKTLNDEHATYSQILELLLERDDHLKQTPLHVALKNRSSESSDAARYFT